MISIYFTHFDIFSVYAIFNYFPKLEFLTKYHASFLYCYVSNPHKSFKKIF